MGDYPYEEAERSEREVMLETDQRGQKARRCIFQDGEGSHRPRIGRCLRELEKAGNDPTLCPPPLPRRNAASTRRSSPLRLTPDLCICKIVNRVVLSHSVVVIHEETDTLLLSKYP